MDYFLRTLRQSQSCQKNVVKKKPIKQHKLASSMDFFKRQIDFMFPGQNHTSRSTSALVPQIQQKTICKNEHNPVTTRLAAQRAIHKKNQQPKNFSNLQQKIESVESIYKKQPEQTKFSCNASKNDDIKTDYSYNNEVKVDNIDQMKITDQSVKPFKSEQKNNSLQALSPRVLENFTNSLVDLLMQYQFFDNYEAKLQIDQILKKLITEDLQDNFEISNTFDQYNLAFNQQ